MRNNCCGFNLCPLIIAVFLGAIVAVLAYLGIITILPTIIPYLLLVIGIIALGYKEFFKQKLIGADEEDIIEYVERNAKIRDSKK